MKIIKPSYEILDVIDPERVMKKLELAGRICYKSEDRIKEGSAEQFVTNLIKRGHESVIEHFSFSVRFICDRGVTHEMVRHRLASYSQESTRYCNYSKDGFGNEITVIEPSYLDKEKRSYAFWQRACEEAEKHYFWMLGCGCAPQEARVVLPNSLKTEIIMTANLREWRHFLKVRTAKNAHPQIRELAIPLLEELQELLPVIFGDIVL